MAFWPLCAVPATFMSAVSCTYILMAQEGLGLPQQIAYPIGALFALGCAALFAVGAARKKNGRACPAREGLNEMKKLLSCLRRSPSSPAPPAPPSRPSPWRAGVWPT